MRRDPIGELSWAPPIGEALGAERAQFLVAWLRAVMPPVVADAVRTLLDCYPGAALRVDMCRVDQLASQTRHAHMEGIYVGDVWAKGGGTQTQTGFRARFDGTVEWYWVVGEGEYEPAAWAQFVALLPDHLTAAGWVVWGFFSGRTVFGDPLHTAMLRKDLDDPDGDRATGEGPTREEALGEAIREALTIEAASQSRSSQE